MMPQASHRNFTRLALGSAGLCALLFTGCTQSAFDERVYLEGRDQDRALVSRATDPVGRAISQGLVGIGDTLSGTPARRADALAVGPVATGSAPPELFDGTIVTTDVQIEALQYFLRRDFAVGDPRYVEVMEFIARDPRYHPEVRAFAVRFLNRARHEPAADLYVAALADEEQAVRLEAAKALSNMPNDLAVADLVRALNDPREDMDVRISVAQALRHYPTLPVAQALVDQLDERDFSVAWQSRASLVQMTGRDLGYDVAAWLQYLLSEESGVS